MHAYVYVYVYVYVCVRVCVFVCVYVCVCVLGVCLACAWRVYVCVLCAFLGICQCTCNLSFVVFVVLLLFFCL